ncbi:hypothetical protein Tco_1420722 [Tanacetum coccineum]
MEILLEPTSNKLMVDSILLAGNPVKEILLKLNLPDHRILKDGGEDFRYSDTERLSRSDEVLKLKNFKKDATLKLFKSTNQESSWLGTIKSVRSEIHEQSTELRLEIQPKDAKSKVYGSFDRKRSGLMIELIDKQLREREIIRNLERLVGARELEMDYKLMTRTVYSSGPNSNLIL